MVYFEDGHVEGVDDLADADGLPLEVVGHAEAGRLVGGVLFVPERLHGRIKRDGGEGWLEVVENAQEDAGEAVDGRHDLAGAAHGEFDRSLVRDPWKAKNER